MKIKLAMLGPYPPDVNNIGGGVEAAIVYLTEGLRGIPDIDIHVISCRMEFTRPKVVIDGNITVHYLPFTRHFDNISLGLRHRDIIKKKIKEIKPDIIHSHNQTTYSCAAFETKYPAIMTVHGIKYKGVKFQGGLLNRIRKFPVMYIEKTCLKKALNIISISPYVNKAVGHLTKARFFPIECAVSSRYFNIKKNEEQDTILFAGPVRRLKNVLGLVKAVNRVKKEIFSVKLRIAGEIKEPRYFELIKDYIAENGLGDNVIFLGRLSEDRLTEEYGRCSMLVLTSFEDVSPLAVIQAMAAGKAVVASSVGGMPFLLKEGKTGFLVDCEDAVSTADRIKLILKDKQLREKLGQNARKEAFERFDPGIVAKRTVEAYRSILEDKA